MNCATCQANLYDSADLARAHAELLEIGRSVTLVCPYCSTVVVRNPNQGTGHPGSSQGSQQAPPPRPPQQRRATQLNPYQVQPAAAMTGSYPARTPVVRDVGCLLAIGIFFVPYVFAWVTLTRGYSSAARIIAFAWLGVIALSIING